MGDLERVGQARLHSTSASSSPKVGTCSVTAVERGFRFLKSGSHPCFGKTGTDREALLNDLQSDGAVTGSAEGVKAQNKTFLRRYHELMQRRHPWL